MKYCKTCLATNLRPNSSFNSSDICIACEYHINNTTKSSISSLEKLKKLKLWIKELQVRRGCKRKNNNYDCIVGVSGGKDSTRQAHWVRDRLGLKPLLICGAYPPMQMTTIGGKNLANLIRMNFDLEVICPAPQTSSHLSLLSFKKFGNVCKSTELALFSIVPRIAIEKRIPLIFWGENPALQVGDSATLGENEFDGSNLRFLNTLIEGGNNWMSSRSFGQHLNFYSYPNFKDLKKYGIDIIFLGTVWDDWSEDENSLYASLSGLELRPKDINLTGDISGASMLDEEFTNINMMLKYFKFGFGRATDTVNEKIRLGLMTRSKAVEIVKKYDGVCDESIIKRYCDYVNISKNKFWEIANKFVNKKIFNIKEGKKPKPKFEVGVNFDKYN